MGSLYFLHEQAFNDHPFLRKKKRGKNKEKKYQAKLYPTICSKQLKVTQEWPWCHYYGQAIQLIFYFFIFSFSKKKKREGEEQNRIGLKDDFRFFWGRDYILLSYNHRERTGTQVLPLLTCSWHKKKWKGIRNTEEFFSFCALICGGERENNIYTIIMQKSYITSPTKNNLHVMHYTYIKPPFIRFEIHLYVKEKDERERDREPTFLFTVWGYYSISYCRQD